MSVETVTLKSGQTVKLGRKRPKATTQALRLAAYLRPSSFTPPAGVDYSPAAAASLAHMYLNDTYGDCVIAGKAHSIGVWTGNEEGSAAIGTDNEIYSQYQTICGPGDNGCNITDVLDYMKSKGFTLSGKSYKIDGYVSIDWTNKLEVQAAIFIFGALTVGINLPNDWTNAGSGVVWDTTNSQIVGGHDVTIYGYNSTGVLISTWGKTGTVITWSAFTSRTWIEELYAVLSSNWYDNATKVAPSGIDAVTLATDLTKLGGGVIPDITPPSPPSPPSPPVPVVPPVPPVVPPAPPSPEVYNGTATLTGSIPTGLFGHMTSVTFTGPVTLTQIQQHNRTPGRKFKIPLGINFNFTVVLDIFALLAAVRTTGQGALIADFQAVEAAITGGGDFVSALENLLEDAIAVDSDPGVVAAAKKLIADLGITV